MGNKVLIKGNEAIGEAAIRAGCQCFFGYPITPQTEVAAYMSRKMPKLNRVYLQAESEVAAIHMVYGAAAAGARVMTSSSSPGISLKQEGISSIAAAELPCVIVNIARGGPGIGGIQPAQSDYFQATKGGGHGDYRLVVLAPSSVQEMFDFIQEAFDIADQYRNPVMVMGDGMLGQMMEPVEFEDRQGRNLPEKTWATTGLHGRKERNMVKTLFLAPEECEKRNLLLNKKYQEIEKNEVRYELYSCDNNCDMILAAYGATARICKNAIKMAEKEGIRLGLIRPITLWPFPVEAFEKVIDKTEYGFLAVEMSMGQLVEDVALAVNGRKHVSHYGRCGGMVPSPKEIVETVKKIVSGGIK